MKVSCRPAVTLDGFIADPNGECYSWINPRDEARYNQARREFGAELLGRRTYEQYQSDYDSEPGVTFFVYTRQSKYKDQANIKFVHGDPRDVLLQISGHGFKRVLISGGGELNGLMASAGLIDEFWPSFHPVTLGTGIRAFGRYEPQMKLKHTGTNLDVPGVVQCRYEVIKLK